jgi:CRISPR-associated protein Cas5d
MMNDISFRLRGRYAMFTDPVTRIGGEKCSYHVPTYEAIKGVLKSIYWKPTIIWYVDKVRVMNPIRTQTKGTKPRVWGGSTLNSLSIYTFLHEVEYEVLAHFEWNKFRPELSGDRIDGKHFSIARRMLEKGGRQDIFLGTRDCQGYVEPCRFGEKKGAYDDVDELSFGLMFHSFDYPDETGTDELAARFWKADLLKGILDVPRPDACEKRRFIRKMSSKKFGLGTTVSPVEQEEILI